MQLFYHPNVISNNIELNPEESKHLIKVLRKTQGDKIQLTDGKGSLVIGNIIDASPKKTKVQVENRQFVPEDDFFIHLAITPTKNADRMEWMVEKIAELGVHEITFMLSEHSERPHLKLDRLEKKIIAACKQSLKARFPKLNPICPLEDLVKDKKFDEYQRFIAYVDKENDRHLFEKVDSNRAYIILIGP